MTADKEAIKLVLCAIEEASIRGLEAIDGPFVLMSPDGLPVVIPWDHASVKNVMNHIMATAHRLHGEFAQFEDKLQKDLDSRDAEILRLKEQVKVLSEGMNKIAQHTERISVPCPGSHSQYSSMADDTKCNICGRYEDGPGDYVQKEVPTRIALGARETLERADKLNGRSN